MKATKDIRSLEEKKRRNEMQVKIAKNTSGVFQPCDVGNGHVRLGHWVQEIGPDDVANLGVLENATATIQLLRQEGKLNITTEKAQLIIKSVARILQNAQIVLH